LTVASGAVSISELLQPLSARLSSIPYEAARIKKEGTATMLSVPSFRPMCAVAACCMLVSITTLSYAQPVSDINGLFEFTRVFDNDPGSTLTVDTSQFPTNASIDERNYATGSPNRHDLLFSSDGGATSRLFDTQDEFDISVDITMDVGQTSPRKETGLRINKGGFDLLFIITTGPPEIVAFGGPIPEFVSFDQTFGINYTPGETINMRMKYLPPDEMDPMANPGSIEFFVDLASDMSGPFSSGPLTFANLEGGILDGSEIGVYGQGAGTLPSDFITVNFDNFDFDGPDAISCDFDNSGSCDIDDIDALVMEVVAGTNVPMFDLNGDSLVNIDDMDDWRAQAGALNLVSGNAYLVGDIDLDGTVDGLDFIEWNTNKFMPSGKWSLGDLNADGATDGLDFIEWNTNKFMSADQLSAVPEPGAFVLFLMTAAVCCRRRRLAL
jgi:hypothetical protein